MIPTIVGWANIASLVIIGGAVAIAIMTIIVDLFIVFIEKLGGKNGKSKETSSEAKGSSEA